MVELPRKIGDKMVMETPGRLSEVELRELAVELVEGRVFMTNTEEGVRCAFGLLIAMLDWDEVAEQVGAIYESYSKAGQRGINGYPFFTSMKLLHADDLPLLMNAAAEYEKARESFKQPAYEREVRECHPEGKYACYCDSGHVAAGTVCMFCWYEHPELRP